MKQLFLILAFISLLLGIIGSFIPVLPTTPFLLLSYFLFSKSSEKYQTWFKKTKVYNKYLDEFMINKSMTTKSKLLILIPVTTLLVISIIIVDNLLVRILLVFVIIFKYYYFIFKIKSRKKLLLENTIFNEKIL